MVIDEDMERTTMCYCDSPPYPLSMIQVMEAALLALETGDVSTIQPQPCLQRKNESAYGSYEEVNLFQIWRRDDHNESIQGGHMAQVLTSVKAIYSTYASRCCEVRPM